MEMTAPAVLRRRPYWRFSAVKDSRTTKVCQACAGTILPADHPWWKSHVPPLHFNCRSTFVPMTEKDALAAGITAHPPEVRAALGFGSPPFGVPAAARDMPTEAQREAAEKASVEVQTAVEERNNASAEVTEAKREKTATAQAKKAAEKAVLEADPKELPARQAELERADKADKKAKENLTEKKKVLEKAEKRADAAEEKHDGEPRNWLQVPARLVRLAVGVAAPAVSLWRKLSELFVAGFDFAALGRGALSRAWALMKSERGFAAIPNGQKNPWEKLIERVQKEKRIGKPLTKDEIEKAKRLEALPKDMSKIVSPKSKHILNKKFKLKGKLCSCVPESREAEVESDFTDIVSGKIQPVWMETLDSQGVKKIGPVFKGKGGILYHFGQGANANTLAIVGGKDVLQVTKKEIDALREIVKNGMDVENACQKRSVESEKIKKILTDFSLSGESK